MRSLEAIAVDWPTFVEAQLQACLDGIAVAGLDERWARDVRAFFADRPPLFEPGFEPVLLSADLTDEHILVSQCGERWEVTGFIDFGDAILGHPHCEFAAPVCSIAHGSPRLRRAMLLAYGFSGEQLNEDLASRLMAYTLLHRFIGIPELLGLLDLPETVGLENVRHALWFL